MKYFAICFLISHEFVRLVDKIKVGNRLMINKRKAIPNNQYYALLPVCSGKNCKHNQIS